MNENENKPNGDEGESGVDDSSLTGGLVPNDGTRFFFDNTNYVPRDSLLGQFIREKGLDKPGTFNATIIIQSDVSWEKSEEYRAALAARRSFQISMPLNPDNIPSAEPSPEIMRKFAEEFGMPPNMVQNFSSVPQDAKPVSVDAVDVLMTQYKSLMEKAEAKGIKKGWVFCVPPQFIPVLQAQLKPFAKEVAPVPISGLSQLAGTPIYAVHTESGQMEYMPYEVAMAKYGNQILLRERSSEGENED